MTDTDLHPLELALLRWLSGREQSSDTESIQGAGLDEGSYRRAAQWLLARGFAGVTSSETTITVGLGSQGHENLEKGTTPELALARFVREGGTSLHHVQQDQLFGKGQWGSALGALMKESVLGGSPDSLRLLSEDGGVFRRVWDETYEKIRHEEYPLIGSLSPDVAAIVGARAPKRGKTGAEFVIEERTETTLAITTEGRIALALAGERKTIGALTREILASNEWKNGTFRRYQVDIPPARIHAGRLHPYGCFLDRVRAKFTAMGFEEMTGPLAESEFWNNDALFMPQFHAARDIHDAYYLEEGASVEPPEPGVFERVARVHRDGGDTGGRGWEYDFSPEKTLSTVLRSQGTALSARTLASGPNIPGKYFGIAKCFRYDQVDATHLPDFYQVEGIVLGKDINFRHLLGLLKLFAEEIAGAESYRYVPAYFPFTEPSVELHVKHSVLGWFEMGGAGLFREEVTGPLGIDVPVIAWGLGLDRMALLAMGLSDIRDLVTPDLARLRGMTVKPDGLLGRKV
ncbi:MAG: phenylalanine--tRNA ligase subunit alpha [Candidatus Fermentibacteraceae bacterium]